MFWKFESFCLFREYDYDYSGDDEEEYDNVDVDHVYIDGSVVSDSCAGSSCLLLLKNLSWAKPSYDAWVVIFGKK